MVFLLNCIKSEKSKFTKYLIFTCIVVLNHKQMQLSFKKFTKVH